MDPSWCLRRSSWPCPPAVALRSCALRKRAKTRWEIHLGPTLNHILNSCILTNCYSDCYKLHATPIRLSPFHQNFRFPAMDLSGIERPLCALSVRCMWGNRHYPRVSQQDFDYQRYEPVAEFRDIAGTLFGAHRGNGEPPENISLDTLYVVWYNAVEY